MNEGYQNNYSFVSVKPAKPLPNFVYTSAVLSGYLAGASIPPLIVDYARHRKLQSIRDSKTLQASKAARNTTSQPCEKSSNATRVS